MPGTEDIRWFKGSFGLAIAAAVQGTQFDPDHIIAIACQETGYIWSSLQKAGLTVEQVIARCVGDTIDYKGPGKGRQAFPRNRADLIAADRGQDMFDIARAALVDMAKFIGSYRSAAGNPDKFCRGFGVFQRDLQFFKDDPDYFLERRYEIFSNTLEHCLRELRRGVKKLGLDSAPRLSDADFCKVAIAYNTGGYKASKGLKQGHFDGQKYYGEWIAEYVALSRAVAAEALSVGGRFTVVARSGVKLRNGPGTNFDWERVLPLATELIVVRPDIVDPAWSLVDLNGDGLVDGYVFTSFLSSYTTGVTEHVAEPN